MKDLDQCKEPQYKAVHSGGAGGAVAPPEILKVRFMIRTVKVIKNFPTHYIPEDITSSDKTHLKLPKIVLFMSAEYFR